MRSRITSNSTRAPNTETPEVASASPACPSPAQRIIDEATAKLIRIEATLTSIGTRALPSA